MNTAAYLQRLNYTDSLTPSSQTLRALQLSHLFNVPFENLSIHNNEPIQLSQSWLFDKIITRQRGGFCYELNGLFAELLRELGFAVVLLSAEVANAQGEFGPPFDHLTLLVTLEQRWLVDVGFGDSFRAPLLLDARTVQAQAGVNYQLVERGEQLVLMQQKQGKAWQPQFRFALQAHQLAEYAEMCYFHQHSAESPFTQKRVCTLATPTGRKTLSGNKFIVTTLDGQRQEQAVLDEASFTAVLREQFGIELVEMDITASS